jgi:predicted transcriptional regulator
MSDLTIRVETDGEFFARAEAAMERLRAGDDRPEFALSYASAETLFATLTPARWRVMRDVAAAGPSSIRAVARRLSRDYKSVHGDVAVLLAAGLAEKDDAGRVVVPWTRVTTSVDLAA